MKAPARDPGDFGIALGAESALFIPEITKSAGTPERFQHVSPFAFFSTVHRKSLALSFYKALRRTTGELDQRNLSRHCGCPVGNLSVRTTVACGKELLPLGAVRRGDSL